MVDVTRRWFVVLVACGMLTASAHPVAGQERLAAHAASTPSRIQDRTTVVAGNAPVDLQDDAIAAAKRYSDLLSQRLRPLADRLHDDRRFRSAGALVGLSAIALGALRGQAALTFVGTQAIRTGLDSQLDTVRKHTGFSVAPSIGYRSFKVVVTR